MDIVTRLRAKCEGWQIGASICGGPAPVEELAAVEIETLRKDAARYLWLRDTGDGTWEPLAKRVPEGAVGIDAAIDAAMLKTPNNKL